ncbi:MAG: hypothetical protein Q4F67_12110, partial [Propionibacteriaceae bacterium]|nr:hypothetical protein [Propionibacteriaceae bacterium]
MSQPPGFPPRGGSSDGAGGDRPWDVGANDPWAPRPSPPRQDGEQNPWDFIRADGPGPSSGGPGGRDHDPAPTRSGPAGWPGDPHAGAQGSDVSWAQTPPTQQLPPQRSGSTVAFPAQGPGEPGSADAPGPDAPVPLGPPAKPRDPKRTALIVGASALVLALVVVGAVLFRNHQARLAEERAAEAARIAEEERVAELGRQESAAGSTAQGFLDALVAANAEQALTFAAAEPEGNNELLTNEVLTEANNRAAFTGVSVDTTTLTEESPGVWNTGTAQVRYSIGDQPQTVDLPLRKVDGVWKVDRVTAPVELGLNGPDRVVNGATVRPGAYNMFPGSYSVGSANPLIG